MPTKGKRYFFECKQWLAKDKEDGKTTRVFKHMDNSTSANYKPSKNNSLALCRWIVIMLKLLSLAHSLITSSIIHLFKIFYFWNKIVFSVLQT